MGKRKTNQVKAKGTKELKQNNRYNKSYDKDSDIKERKD